MDNNTIDKETDLHIIRTLFERCESYSEFINYYSNFVTFITEKEIYSLRTNTKFL